MKTKFRKGSAVILAMILLLALTLSSCSFHIEDTNGDDISPVTLTDEDIIDGRSCVRNVFTSTTNSDGTHVKCKKLSGVTSLTGIGSGKTLTYTAATTAGNIRICVVSASGSIYADLILDGVPHTLTLPEASGLPAYTLKVAGESAAFTMDYKIDS